jgi:DNA recombination protein RmuC
MNTVTVVLIAAVVCIVFLIVGWVFGGRLNQATREGARAEGRTESSVDLARAQEKLVFLEESVRQERERTSALELQVRQLQERAQHAETECVQLRERLAGLSDVEQARVQAENIAAGDATELATQRELASRLTAQLEGAATVRQQLQERVTQLSKAENDLRGELTGRDSEIVAQREAVSGLRAQWEAAVARDTRANERITELAGIEHTLRGQLNDRETTLRAVSEQLGALRSELSATKSSVGQLIDVQAQWDRERADLQEQLVKLNVTNAELQTALSNERIHSEEKLAVLVGARDALVDQFKSLAADIMEEKSKRFTEQNTTALGQLLSPVREQLQAFQQKVDDVYRTEGNQRAALGEQLKQLMQLNQSLSADAQNLTHALKGDQKTQGIWGEIVLDTVLEQAGLIEGTQYERQAPYESEEQRRAIPDVVLRLPGDRQLVVDSKVSLTAYERSATAISPEEREVHIKQHLTSVRNHIRSLSEKNYQQLYQLKSLDFVLMFIPLESAFATAVSHDNLLFRDAWERNVILVGPSTLLFVVRTVAYLWRQENQTSNVMEIAKRGATLYDKLCGFVDDLQDVGKRIQQTGKAYDSALRKLAIGDGNVIRQAEMLRDLGVKPGKQLPMALVDKALSMAQQSLVDEVEGNADTAAESTVQADSGHPLSGAGSAA